MACLGITVTALGFVIWTLVAIFRSELHQFDAGRNRKPETIDKACGQPNLSTRQNQRLFPFGNILAVWTAFPINIPVR
jgi:hypothetical protein